MSAEEDMQRYKDALHAVMTGVGYKITFDPTESGPKHLRTGINSAHISSSALANLLIDKGIITNEEWCKYLADLAENEKKMYKVALQEHWPNVDIELI